MTASIRVLAWATVAGDKVTLCTTAREATNIANERNRSSARMLHSVARVAYTKNRVTGNISEIRVGRAM